MSFFELDGGGKAKARKSTKSKAKTTKTKKTPTKKSSGKKKGGNFLGTVSELFAPAGWENFVTAAGLLALDRTDNFLRKSKDSKKQKGGADDIKGEEEMTGGARKRSSSRKQRGGSDGHHTIEDLDMRVGGSEEQDTTAQPDAMSQTGGAKKRSKSKGKGKKGHRGGAMSDDEKTSFLSTYHREPEEAKQLIQIYDNVSLNNTLTNNNQSSRANKIISKVIKTYSQSVVPASAPIVGNNMGTSAETNLNQPMQQQANTQQANTQQANSLFSVGGKKSKSKSKSKAKSSTKKPKAKKASKRK